jgi:aminoglycoside phosphotransferase (APT) family kinase protein
VRQGIVLALSPRGVLRVALGPARRQVIAQRVALARLAAAEPPSAVRELVPWTLASGEAGLASWTLERRLPGVPVSPELVERLLPQCVDFLVALHGCARDTAAEPLAAAAAAVSRHLPGRDANDLVRMAEHVDRAVVGLPRGYGHGDLCPENLLAQGERLTGTVDWEAAGPGRLPLVDLLHLLTTTVGQREGASLGVALVHHVLPVLRGEGDATMRAHVLAYCERVGVPAEPRLLEALLAASWLSYVDFQLHLYADRAQRPAWVGANVLAPLHMLREAGERRFGPRRGAAQRRRVT